MNRQACYPSGGQQAPAVGRVFQPGVMYNMLLARGEGGAANTLPWLIGATLNQGADFGFWLNVPGMGNMTFDARDAGNRSMSFSMAASPQLDYIVTTTPAPAVMPTAAAAGAGRGDAYAPPAGGDVAAAQPPNNESPAATTAATTAGAPAGQDTSFFDILENFVGWVGTSPALPDWTLGYWHSKNRYASQEELLEAARGFHNRSVPVDVIVIDWLHWKVQGDWHFDPEYWQVKVESTDEKKGIRQAKTFARAPWCLPRCLPRSSRQAGQIRVCDGSCI